MTTPTPTVRVRVRLDEGRTSMITRLVDDDHYLNRSAVLRDAARHACFLTETDLAPYQLAEARLDQPQSDRETVRLPRGIYDALDTRIPHAYPTVSDGLRIGLWPVLETHHFDDGFEHLRNKTAELTHQ